MPGGWLAWLNGVGRPDYPEWPGPRVLRETGRSQEGTGVPGAGGGSVGCSPGDSFDSFGDFPAALQDAHGAFYICFERHSLDEILWFKWHQSNDIPVLHSLTKEMTMKARSTCVIVRSAVRQERGQIGP